MKEKFVFVTGAPGSAWSMISHRLKHRVFKDFDFSDETDDRSYDLPADHKKNNFDEKDNSQWTGKTHIGCYFGPGQEFGGKFDDLPNNYSIKEFYQECLAPFSDNNKPKKLIKSHWFAYNLDWIWENCQGQDLMLVWRDAQCAKDWWYSVGGWSIKHPSYDWYKNDERMWEKIQEESNKIKEFGDNKGLTWLDWNDHKWIEEQFNLQSTWPPAVKPKFKDTIKIAYATIK